MISYESQIIGTIHDKIGEVKENLSLIVTDNKPVPEKFTIEKKLKEVEELLKEGVIVK